jgi:anti-sigma factor RsiW
VKPKENRVQCAESLRLQAYFDHEVDAVGAADIERHLEHCAQCHALLEDLEEVRATLRRDLAFVRAPPALHAGIQRALDEQSAAESLSQEIPAPGPGSATAPPGAPAPTSSTKPVHATASPRLRAFPRGRMHPIWAAILGGAGGAAAAAALAFFLLAPRLSDPLLDQLVSAHVRSLMPDHLIDVVSTDKHTVKPWFAGHTDVSPVVADFEAQGFRLIGGRADYLDHQRSAVVVYRHGAHFINVFSWAGNERIPSAEVTRNGYHLAFWKAGNLEYCAVSDTSWDELTALVRLLEDLGARDSRE